MSLQDETVMEKLKQDPKTQDANDMQSMYVLYMT